jgi:hypothetical protein
LKLLFSLAFCHWFQGEEFWKQYGSNPYRELVANAGVKVDERAVNPPLAKSA